MTEFNFDGPCTPGDLEWERRLALFLADNGPIEWCWLSFVDTEQPYTAEGDYPGGPRFLGVCIVPAPNIVVAAMIAHQLGCNPGGQIRMAPAVPPGWRPKPEFVGRLFGAELGQLELHEYAEEVT